jgi:acetoin utilization protein AcuB
MRVQDVMSKDVISVTPADTVAEARERLQLAGINHLVVMEARQVVGVVAVKDLPAANEEPLAQVMSRNVATIEPEATLRRAAGVMRGRNIGCLPVVDHGRLVGIVTTSDLLTALAKGEVHAASPRTRATLRKRGPRKGAGRAQP